MKRLLLLISCFLLWSIAIFAQSNCPDDTTVDDNTTVVNDRVQAAKNLQLTRKIKSASTLKIRAGETIEFLPGFDMEVGGTIETFVGEDCEPFTTPEFNNKKPPRILSDLSEVEFTEKLFAMIPIVAVDGNGKTGMVTFSAENLPLGLSINESTGVIYGEVEEGTYTGTPYNIQIKVADKDFPALSSTKSFDVPLMQLPPDGLGLEPLGFYVTCSSTPYGLVDATMQVFIHNAEFPVNIEWSTGETEVIELAQLEELGGGTLGSIVVDEPGHYSVTVTDATGATSSCRKNVGEELGVCEGSCITLGSDLPTGNYCYRWYTSRLPKYTGEFKDCENVNAAGECGEQIVVVCPDEPSYVRVQVSDGLNIITERDYFLQTNSEYNGDATLSVTINPVPDGATLCTDENGDISPVTLEAIVEGEKEFTYTWSTDEIESRIQITEIGDYAVTVSDLNGCKGTASFSPDLCTEDNGTPVDFSAEMCMNDRPESTTPNSLASQDLTSGGSIWNYAGLPEEDINEIKSSVNHANELYGITIDYITSPAVDADDADNCELEDCKAFNNAKNQFDIHGGASDVLVWIQYGEDGNVKVSIKYSESFFERNAGLDNLTPEAIADVKALTTAAFKTMFDCDLRNITEQDGTDNPSMWRLGIQNNPTLYDLFGEALGISKSILYNGSMPEDIWITDGRSFVIIPPALAGMGDCLLSLDPISGTTSAIGFAHSFATDAQTRQAIIQSALDPINSIGAMFQDELDNLTGANGLDQQHYAMGSIGTSVVTSILTGGAVTAYALYELFSKKAKDGLDIINEIVSDMGISNDPQHPFNTELAKQFPDGDAPECNNLDSDPDAPKNPKVAFSEFLAEIGKANAKKIVDNPKLIRLWKKYPNLDWKDILNKFPEKGEKFYESFENNFIDPNTGEFLDKTKDFLDDLNNDPNLATILARLDGLGIDAWKILHDGLLNDYANFLTPENLNKLADYLASFAPDRPDIDKLIASLKRSDPEYRDQWIKLKIPESELGRIYAESVASKDIGSYVSGTPAHKAQRWEQYKRGSNATPPTNDGWDYERWSRQFDENQTKAKSSNKAVDKYYNDIDFDCPPTLGRKCREVPFENIQIPKFDANGNPIPGEFETVGRRADIANGEKAIEHKKYSGTVYLTKDIRRQVYADRKLLEDGTLTEIEWVFEGCEPSGPLLDLLNQPITLPNGTTTTIKVTTIP